MEQIERTLRLDLCKKAKKGLNVDPNSMQSLLFHSCFTHHPQLRHFLFSSSAILRLPENLNLPSAENIDSHFSS